ncbi:hypothetical protein GF312_10765 [Candidatus Poribacteria bacterium]|nr:hypothetical protein [Candidatus Poribacteria bacterium]
MKRKAFLIFITISAMIMITYIICIGDPPPTWGEDYSDSNYGTIDNPNVTLYSNVYCAVNISVGGAPYTYRTYHWAHVERADGDPDGKQKFYWSFEHDPGGAFGGGEGIDNPWERENYYTTQENGGQTKYPYTHTYWRMGGQTDEVTAGWPRGSGIEIPD